MTWISRQLRKRSTFIWASLDRGAGWRLDAGALSLLVPWCDVRQHLPGRHLFCTVEGETTGGRWSTGGVREFLNNTRDGAGVAAERLHPQAFRYSLLAELIIEQWPLSYIQQQFGLNSARSVEKLLAHLGIEPPTEDEVMDVIRTRDWEPRAEPAQSRLDLGT